MREKTRSSLQKSNEVKTEKFEMIAKTFQGLEDVLAQEITAMGGEEVEMGKRMVSFIGDNAMMYKANLCLHTALRILKPINTFTASNTDEVYEAIKTIKWEEYLREDQTFSIDSVVFSDDFRHSKFVTYRVKDAIADYFMEKSGNRPSVRLSNADLALNLHIAGRTCTLSLDSSGESLHKRGYRVDQTEAPLNEVLAAGMIMKSGWHGEKNFIDPMCGSGTLLIEAALIATNTMPGIYRQGFAFEKWKDYDAELFDSIYNDDSQERDFEFKIYGSDISPRAIAIAEENIKSAGLAKYISLKTLPLQQYALAPENATLIMNPPYGERISSRDILSLYEMIGTQLKHVFKGYEAWILSYHDECFEKIGLKPSEKIELMNGGLECQFRKYEIFDGKFKDFRSEGNELNKESAVEAIESEDNGLKREIRKDRFLKVRGSRDRRDSAPRRSSDRGRERNGDRETRFFGEDRGERKFGDRPSRFSKDGEGRGERKFGDRPSRFSRDGEGRGERKFGDRPSRFSRDGEGRGERKFGDRPSRFSRDGEGRGERKFGDRPSRFSRERDGESRDNRYENSGNFRRNAEGKLELRTDGEFKPRGERTFNPNRPMNIPGRNEKQDSSDKEKGED